MLAFAPQIPPFASSSALAQNPHSGGVISRALGMSARPRALRRLRFDKWRYLHVRDAIVDHPKLSGGLRRHVENARFRHRATVGDFHDRSLAIVGVGDLSGRAKRKRSARGGQLPRIHQITAGSKSFGPVGPVERGDPGLSFARMIEVRVMRASQARKPALWGMLIGGRCRRGDRDQPCHYHHGNQFAAVSSCPANGGALHVLNNAEAALSIHKSTARRPPTSRAMPASPPHLSPSCRIVAYWFRLTTGARAGAA